MVCWELSNHLHLHRDFRGQGRDGYGGSRRLDVLEVRSVDFVEALEVSVHIDEKASAVNHLYRKKERTV